MRAALDKAREAPASTKARILAAAEEVFATSGFAGASTREIAAAAQVNISSLHYHWESKETLYLAVFQNVYDRILDLVRRSIPPAVRPGQSERAVVDTAVGALFDFFADHPTVPKLLVRRLLRYFNAAGADPEGEIGENHEPETHLIPLVIDALLGRRPCVEVFGTDYPTPDGTAIRDYIHVTDLAEVHVLALKSLLEEEGICLNLGTGKGHSVRVVIHAVEEASGQPVPIKETGRRLGDPPVLIAESGRAMEQLGWKPRYTDLRSIVDTALLWHKTDKARNEHKARKR